MSEERPGMRYVTPTPITDAPPQETHWPCMKCLQDFEYFGAYIAHKCATVAPVLGAFKPKEAA